jgi:hypothetical protein
MSDKITKEQVIEAIDLMKAYVEQDGGSVEGADVVSIPSAEDVAGMDMEKLTEVAGSLNIDVTGKKEKAVRKLILTLAQVGASEETNETDLDLLAEALGLTADDDAAVTTAAIKEWIEALGVAGEASTEAEPAAEGEAVAEEGVAEAEPEAAAAEAEAAADGSDGVDRETIAKAVKKFPDSKTMTAQLTAYNAKAETPIVFSPKKEATIKPAYITLMAELVNSSEEVAAWGVAYVRDNAGWCCGLPLEDIKVKGVKEDCGKCQVTGAVFSFDGSDFKKLVLKTK